jgi:diadenosine tetraphosphate (Ap4A) HIT family hydrolase
MMPNFLLKKNDLPLKIEIHSDPLSILPAALSRTRAFKRNKILQEEAQDNEGGAAKCLFCNPELLDGKPTITKHCEGNVVSFPNAAPFLPGDQRVLFLWHDDHEKRYAYAHRYRFADFCIEEFYYMVKAAVELSKSFPSTKDGQTLQKGLNLIRCVAGFNIGKLAGQSIPHFHLQYGWEVALTSKDIRTEVLSLYYSELDEEKLILYEDSKLYLVVPWTPKGQYHIEIHFKNKYELSHLDEQDIIVLSYVQKKIMRLYESSGIKNINVFFTGSPHDKIREPLVAQFVPRVNMTAVYEMIGVNVVDTLPEDISAFFTRDFRWSDVFNDAYKFDPTELYRKRFAEV